MAGSNEAPEERIAAAFNGYFADFDILIDGGDVAVGSRRDLRKRGWWIAYRVLPDDAGFPSLEFYATHRMTDDRHVRIWADGCLETLDAIRGGFGYNPNVPRSKEAAEEQYLRYNRRVAEQLRAAGLYPGGDVNAYLRTGGDPTDQGTDREGGDDGRTSGPRNGR